MPIAKTDRLNKESTVSRILQQKIPEAVETLTENGETIVSEFQFVDHSELSKKNVIDDKIEQNRDRSSVPVSEMVIKRNTDDEKFEATTIEMGKENVEPLGTSNLGEYNKINVLFDREDHVFFFDWTTGNRRTMLYHPSGTYWSIDDSGNYVIKISNIPDPDNDGKFLGGNFQKFVRGNHDTTIFGAESKFVRKTRYTFIGEDDDITTGGDYHLSVGGDHSFRTENNSYNQMGKDRISIIGRNEVINVQGFKEQNIQGVYVINSLDTILLKAPTVKIETSNLITKNKAGHTEQVGGAKIIQASAIGLTSMNSVGIAAGQNFDVTATGASKETIMGLGIPPRSIAKEISVQLGDIKIETLLGKLDLGNLLSTIGIGTTGDITLSGPLGSIAINITGITEIDGGTQIKLGSGASEPVLKGSATSNWLSTHTHPTGVGPSGPPLEAANLFQIQSTKVFVE